MAGLIAVHVGAGCHASSLHDDYKKLMRKVCKEAVTLLQDGKNAVDIVAYATRALENSPLTNAGYGSSLTYDGIVECDASIMDGKSLHTGSVGAVAGVRNPVLLARELMLRQHPLLPGGLIPPTFLVGTGARTWAMKNGVEVCQSEDLISDNAARVRNSSLDFLKNLERKKEKRKYHIEISDSEEPQLKKGLLDTVGAICVDLEGNVASAVSSGGLILKQSGRVGQAAVYGCGCWSENNCEDSGFNVGVSTSGCGEHLIRTSFARLCAKATASTDHYGSKFLDEMNDSKMAGALCVRYDGKTKMSDLFWLHTTQSMGIAYMTVSCKHAQTLFSELSSDRAGQTVVVNCRLFEDSSPKEWNPKEAPSSDLEQSNNLP